MPQVGDTLHETYRLEGILGEGGFARAFWGTNMTTSERVAVKVLTQTLTPDNAAAFYDEADCTARLNHPNIIKVLDVAPRDSAYPYMVTPLAYGGSVGGYVKKLHSKGELMPLTRSLDILGQMANALTYLHQQYTVHRDVKPDNMLIARPDQPTVWLADLGIHKVLKPDASLRPGAMIGSPQYIAPEQIQGRGVFASDQYALGVTAFLFLTGGLPFTTNKGNALALLQKHLYEAPPHMVDVARARQAGEQLLRMLDVLDPVVAQAIAKDPSKRYSSVLSFTDALYAATAQASQQHLGKLFLGGGVPQAGSTAPEAQTIVDTGELIKQCVALSDRKDYGGLLHASEQLLRRDPASVEGWELRGSALLSLGRKEDALQSYDQALQLDPTRRALRFNHGSALVGLHRYEEALQDFNLALGLDPQFKEAHYGRGLMLFSLGRFGEAIQAFDGVLNLDPQYEQAPYTRSLALALLGRHEEALQAYDRVLSFDPQNKEVHHSRGLALIALHRPAEALQAFNRVLTLDPHNADAYRYCGDTLGKLGYYTEALQAYDRAVGLNPEYTEAHYGRGIVLGLLGCREDEVQAYDRAISLDPQNSHIHHSRGLALALLGRHEEALQAYDRVLSFDPRDARVHRSRAHSLIALGHPAEALQAYSQAVKLNPQDKDTYCEMGIVFCRVDKLAEGQACFRRALEGNPSDRIVRLVEQTKKRYGLN